jgi:hydrogenase expression/formation protein HypC
MCLAIPGRIIDLDGKMAEIDFQGIRRKADISLVEAGIGDYVIVHAGFAITKLDMDEARRTIQLWNEILDQSADLDNIV